MRASSIEIEHRRIIDTVRRPIAGRVVSRIVCGDAVSNLIRDLRIVVKDEVSQHSLKLNIMGKRISMSQTHVRDSWAW